MPSPVTITSADFRNFKALGNYSIKLQHMNVLVGPNNCGKSTILGAFHALVAGLRRARTKSAEMVDGPVGEHFGYRISEDVLPISIENVHTDYAEVDSLVTFRLSNGNRLKLHFPEAGGCALFAETRGKLVRTPSQFKSAFPLTVKIVPVLGPVEHDETILTEDTVRRGLSSHLASRHFRNYWYHYPDGFEKFAALVSKTWPGMEISKPEKVETLSSKLAMFCIENRIPRELFWAGFGFQIWCQLLTHISGAGNDSLLIVDEPEIYLHPDVQRQLIGILRDAGPDIVLATHSAEIMGEADPAEILLVDKTRRSAERLRNVDGIQNALDVIGSIQNITLTQLARNRRMLFVEDPDDYKIVRRFALKIGLTELSAGADITPLKLDGFSSWKEVCSFARVFKKSLTTSMSIGLLLDRDYYCFEESRNILAELNSDLEFAHIHMRKEIENYLLIPSVLEKAVNHAIKDRCKRSGDTPTDVEPISQILNNLTAPLKIVVQAQYIAKRVEYLKHDKKDSATITTETISWFEKKWENLHDRMWIVPGKDILRTFRKEIQERYEITLSDYRIIDEFNRDEMPIDLIEMINRLEKFRKEQ